MIIKALSPSEGMVFNPSGGNADSTFWWEMDGRSLMVLKGDGIDKGFLGLALNIDGTEMPTANLQIGGTGTTGTFQYRDGNQASGYTLTSDANGVATWQPKYSAIPTTSGDTVGGVGSVTWDNNYFYVKTNTGWGRVSLDYGF